MTVIWEWTRLDLRRRWRSLLVLALLIGLAGSVVMTALAGARRGETALDRFIARTTPVDAMVLANTPGFDWSEFDELPYVEARSGFILAFGSGIKELDDFDASDAADFPHADDHLFFEYDQPVIYDGRMYDPTKIEAIVTPDFEKATGFGVGDSFTMRLASAEQADNGTDSLPFDQLEGPEFKVPIVGVARSTWLMDQKSRAGGGFSLSPGVVTTYRESFYGSAGTPIINSQFALKNGRADIPQLRKDVKRITGRADIDVWDWHNEFDAANETLIFEGRSLQAFGYAALLASLFLLGQAITRFASAEAEELRTAQALGMTPRQVRGAAAMTSALAGLVGLTTAVTGSLIASRWFPIGSAAHMEPDPGFDADWLVLGLGAAATLVLVVGAALLGASAALSTRQQGTPGRPSVAARSLAGMSAPVPAIIGTRFALERGRGSGSIPVRPAIVGAIAGLLGVSSVLVFSHAIRDAVDHPERFGETFQLAAFGGFENEDFVPPEAMTATIAGLDDVTGFVDARIGVVTVAGGGGSLELFSYAPAAGKPLKTVILDGRMPETDTEIALTPGKIKDFGVEVGGTLKVEGPKGVETLKVVGSTFVPPGPHNDYDSGAWVTANGYDELFAGFKYHLYYVTTDPSAGSGDKLATRINDQIFAANPMFAEFGEPIVFTPESQGMGASTARKQLEQVQVFPLALAGFLALLAIGTVGHALATAVRRRSHDIAVLRALGLTPGQSRLIVAVQATVLVAVGILFGIPLGLAVGRTIWRAVAEFTPVQYVPPTALIALILVGPAALLISYVVASWPAFRASRLRVASILRAE